MSELSQRQPWREVGFRANGFLPVGLVVGLTLVLVATLVPSPAIVTFLIGTATPASPQLLTGAMLFRIGLGILGFVVIVLGNRSFPLWHLAPDREGSRLEPTPRKALILLGLILVIAATLRLCGLNSGLWLDEIVTDVLYARLPYGAIVTRFDSENQHFLYSLLAHGSFQLFGESPWTLRLPAALFGIGSIGALYLFAREVTRLGEALLSTALLTFSYTHLWFSQNARGYSGLLCLTLLASWLFLRALTTGRPSNWLLYAVSIALGIYVHFTMVFVVVAHLAAYGVLLIRRRRESWSSRWLGLFLGFGMGGLLTFQLYSLVLPQLTGLMGREASVVAAWKNPMWTVLEIAKGLQTNFAGGAIAVAAMIVFAMGALSYLRTKPVVLQLLLFPTILGSIVTIGVGHHLWPRFFFFAIGFGALVVIRGTVLLGRFVAEQLRLGSAKSTWPGIALGCALVLMSAKSIPVAYAPKQDYEGAAAFVEAHAESGDVVVVTGLAAFPYQNFFHKSWQDVESLAALDAARAQAKRTWLIYTFPPVLEAEQPEIMRSIQGQFQVVQQFAGTVDGGAIIVSRSDNPPQN